MKKDKETVIALMYDFDKTLCTKDMQEYTFIPSLGESASKFWDDASKMSKEQKMDPILTYMYLMLHKAKAKDLDIRRDAFIKAGKKIKLFPGVEDWFDRIDMYGKEYGVKIEHYIISSGLREIIEGNSISHKFKEIYACEFFYDRYGVAVWPKLVVNYTSKTQFLFRINKGMLDLSDNSDVNGYINEDDRRIPFRNMIYIGDGMTDVPCMKLVRVGGGKSIAVYSGKDRCNVDRLLKEHRVDYILRADYRKESDIDRTVKMIIEKMSIESKLIDKHRNQYKAII